MKGIQISFSVEEQSVSVIFQTNKNIQSKIPHQTVGLMNNIKYEAAASELHNVSPLSSSNGDFKVMNEMKDQFCFWNLNLKCCAPFKVVCGIFNRLIVNTSTCLYLQFCTKNKTKNIQFQTFKLK